MVDLVLNIDDESILSSYEDIKNDYAFGRRERLTVAYLHAGHILRDIGRPLEFHQLFYHFLNK